MIHSFFEKPINRYIETVIKADDTSNISNEVTEYVITTEIARKIGDFFQAYNNYTGANGVWISGFFGSGKSHLLKILSYVLANLQHDDYKCGELFAEKIEGDEMLKADILRATRTPSESILFNIDQQSQITSKTDAKAILSVFYKVFYDHSGYYGFQPHVAEFESWLDKQGKYAAFKELFATQSGKSWETARIDYFDPMVTDTVAEVLGGLFNSDASKYLTIIDDIEDKHKQSIEDFCERVQEYIQSKQKGFRLNFFVDEVGQYISDNTKLMLNLQTIAESLATRTKGASWILVTSQEDMEKVVGDMNKQQQNDFSRIQARFKIKIPLTSANVDEVIEKRLLKKQQQAQQALKADYKRIGSQLDTLLTFSEAGVQFKGYDDDTDYANKYPFIPYQFDLFQNCRRALSVHNAFQGKHAAIGERSMLSVFQQVVKHIENKEANTLVSFDLMFEGIRNELKGEIQSAIILAENNLDNKMALRILKTLFMVKYFTSFKTTRRNISVLLIDTVKVDLRKHEQEVEEALNTLENQTYIQRNGELYEFMTNDEKDIEEDIKNTDIDDQAIPQHLKTIFYDEIIKDNKIRFTDNKQDYEFTSKIDGSTIGREKELEIDIVTEFNYDYPNETLLKAQTMGSAGVKFVLAPDAMFRKDLYLFLRTNKYVRLNQSTTNRPEYKRILAEKGQQNALRGRNLNLLANRLLAESTVFLNGTTLETTYTTDGKTKVINVFQDLIRMTYPNLRMIGNTLYTEDTIKSTIRKSQHELFGIEEQLISEAENEIVVFINRRKAQSDRTSLLDLRTYFMRKPYGWYPNAIWTLVAKLFKRGRIELKKDANLLEDDQVLMALLNSAAYPNTLLEVPKEIDTKLVKKLKELYKDAFDESCNLTEAKDVAHAFRDKLKDMYVDVNKLLVQQKQYAFLGSLAAFNEKLGKLQDREYSYYLTHIAEFEDDLLDFKEGLLDPVRRFMKGDQLFIYDTIRKLLDGDTSNLSYVEGNEAQVLRELIALPKPYVGDAIREAKAAKDTLMTKVEAKLQEERDLTRQAIDKAIADITGKEEFKKLTPEQQEKILAPFEAESYKLNGHRYIAVIRDMRSLVRDGIFTRQLNEMMTLASPVPTGNYADTTTTKPSVSAPVTHYINKNQVKPVFAKTELKTEADVDEYVEAYRKALKEQIKNNRRIQL